MKNRIEISIIIINLNGYSYVDACIKSILRSNTSNYEIVIVDNGSTDNSIPRLSKKHKAHSHLISYIELDRNYGPSYARNAGVRASNGAFLGFLDNDTVVHPDWAIAAISAFKHNPKLGIIQCKLLLNQNREHIDYVGEYLGQNGFLVQRATANERDIGQHDSSDKILAAKSAGMFIRKKVFDVIGGFDDDYFIYVEETDLGWRCWLYGYECEFCAHSVVYHEYGTSSVILGESKNNYNAKFHGSKNYILTLLKNLETKNLIRILSIHVLLWVGLSAYSLIRGRAKSSYWIIMGILWNMSNIRNSLRKRKEIQKRRIIGDNELFRIIMRKESFMYFVNKATMPIKIGNAEGFIKNYK